MSYPIYVNKSVIHFNFNKKYRMDDKWYAYYLNKIKNGKHND